MIQGDSFGLRGLGFRGVTLKMENQMGEQMEIGIIQYFIGIRVLEVYGASIPLNPKPLTRNLKPAIRFAGWWASYQNVGVPART